MSLPGKGKTQKTTQTENFNASSRPFAPDWVTNAVQPLTQNVVDLAGQNPQNFVAPANPLQTRAGTIAGGLTGTPWNFDAALDLTKGVAQANAPRTEFVSSAPLIDRFLDPNLQNVVNASLANFDYSAGKTRAQQQLDLAKNKAFQGSGFATITMPETEAALARGRADLESGLRSNAFNTALSAAQNEAARRQAANDANAQLMAGGQDRTLASADQIANLASLFGGEQRATAGAQATIGDQLRGVTDEQAKAPLTLQQFASNALPQILSQYFGEDKTGSSTSTSKTKLSDPMGALAKLAGVAALFAGEDDK